MKPMKTNALLGALLAAVATAPNAASADDSGQAPVTWASDIAAIMHANCSECHRPGQIGPMSLLTYEDVRPWAKSIRKSVAEREMPPWDADPQYGPYVNDPTLSEEEIALVTRWVDTGAPAGDLSTAPPTPSFAGGEWRNGTPDQIFTVPKPYHVGDEVEDKYVNFVVPTGLTEEKYLSGIEIRPGAPTAVHHVLLFLLPENFSRSEGMGPELFTQMIFVTGWAPGTPPLKYDEGFGMIIPPNRPFMFQLHYHKEPGAGTGVTDQTSIGVQWSDERPELPTTIAWIVDFALEIPPHDSNYVSKSQFRFMDDGYIRGFVPHMHLRGQSFRFDAHYPDGNMETLLHVPDYDFNWQLTYSLGKKFIPKGTVIKATAVFDNSANNPANPDPDQTVYFSQKTTDEMMIGFMEYGYINRQNMQAKFGLPDGQFGFGGGGGRDRIEEELEERDDEEFVFAD